MNGQIVDYLGPQDRTDYILHVDNGQFFATCGEETLSGSGLVGTRFEIRDHDIARETQVRFERHVQLATWTEPSVLVDAYALAFYRPNTGQSEPLCGGVDADLDSDEALAVVLSGERYGRTTSEVSASGQDAAGWFNIACAGSGLYKMKLMGYEAELADSQARVTTPQQRQATLKMLTASYCPGQAEELTRDGTRLHWRNRDGWSFNPSQYGGVLEAYWDDQGVICLEVPRLGSYEIPRVVELCGDLPTCTGFDGPYEWRTESPPEDGSPMARAPR